MWFLGRETVRQLGNIIYSGWYKRKKKRTLVYHWLSRRALIVHNRYLSLFFQMRLAAEISAAGKMLTAFQHGQGDKYLKAGYQPSAQELEAIKTSIKFYIRQLRWIGDGLAFRMLKFNRLFFRVMSENLTPGYIDISSAGHRALLSACYDLIRRARLIITDVTNFLRVGDLVVIEGRKKTILEVKAGRPYSGKSRQRSERQLKRIMQVVDIMNQDYIEVDNQRVFIEYRDIPFQTHLSQIQLLVAKAMRAGMASQTFDGILSVTCQDKTILVKKMIKEKKRPEEVGHIENPPGTNKSNRIAISSLDHLSTQEGEFIRNAMPYTIFPFSSKQINAIIRGEVVIFSVLNLDALQVRIRDAGWEIRKTFQEYASEASGNIKKAAEVFSGDVLSRGGDAFKDAGIAIRRNGCNIVVPTQYVFQMMMEFVKLDTFLALFEEQYKAGPKPNRYSRMEFVKERKAWR